MSNKMKEVLVMDENNEKNVQNEVKQEVNSNINKKNKTNNGKTIALLVIVLILVLAIGIGSGYLLANKNNQNKDATENNEETEQQIKQEVQPEKENETTKDSEINNLLNQIDKNNFNNIEIGLLTNDYDYIEKITNDYELAKSIINIVKNYKVEEKNIKSLPEMTYVVINYKNNYITLHYNNNNNEFLITTGAGETYRCWGDNNNDLTDLKKIINDYMSKTEESDSNKTNTIQNQTSGNTSNTNQNAYKILGIERNFYKIKDIALIQKEINVNNENEININYDINKDGIEDIIKFEIRTDTSESIPHKYVNILVNGLAGAQINYADDLYKIYIVDCDYSDNYIDLITTTAQGSGWRNYSIYKFNGEEYTEVEGMSCYEDDLYLDQKGCITTRLLNFVTSNPIIASKYYDYTSDRYIDIDLVNFSNVKINFNNVYFSENPEKENEVFEIWENVGFEEALKENNVIYYESVDAYLLGILNTTNGTKYRVRLLDGTVGYFLGPWAG